MPAQNVLQWLSVIQRVSRETGVPVDVILAIVDMESSGNPRAKSAAGALGLGQVMPFHFKKGEDPFDPYTNLSVGIGRVYAPALKRYGSYEKAAAAYFGAIDSKGNVTGAKDATGTDGYAYVKKFSGLRGQYQGTETPRGLGPPAARGRKGLGPPVAFGGGSSPVGTGADPTPSQRGAYTEAQAGRGELTTAEAFSICGPFAAIGFARRYGRNPSVQEAKQLAAAVGWNENQGMAGIGSQHQLMRNMGLDVGLDQTGDWNTISQKVEAGHPVVVSNAAHYFVIDDYDPKTGKYHVGASADFYKGGSDWMSADQIQARGKIQGAIYSPTPATGGGGKISRARPMMATSGTTDPREQGAGAATATPADPARQENPILDELFEAFGPRIQARQIGDKTVIRPGLDPVTGDPYGPEPNKSPTYEYLYRTPWGGTAKIEVQTTDQGDVIVGGNYDAALSRYQKEYGDVPDDYDTWWTRPEAGGPEYQWRRNKRTGETEQVPEDQGGVRYGSKAPETAETREPKLTWQWVPDPANPGQERYVGYDPTTQKSVYMTDPSGQPVTRPAKGAQTDAQGNVINTDTDEPFIAVQQPDGSITWDINKNYKAELEQQGYEVRQGEDGGWWAIDPGTGDAYPIDTGDAVSAPPNYQFREDPATGQIMALDPATGSAVPVSGMGEMVPPEVQLIQNHLDTIDQIVGMLERGEIEYADAKLFIEQSAQATRAAQLGTTPFQQEQERRYKQEEERRLGESMLNQRLQSGASLASSLISSAFNLASTTMMPSGMESIGYDPAALALRLTNELQGGEGITDFARQMLMGAGAAPGAQATPSTPPGTITSEQLKAYEAKRGQTTGASVQPAKAAPQSVGAVGQQIVKAATTQPPPSQPGQPLGSRVISPEQFADYLKKRQKVA